MVQSRPGQSTSSGPHPALWVSLCGPPKVICKFVSASFCFYFDKLDADNFLETVVLKFVSICEEKQANHEMEH